MELVREREMKLDVDRDWVMPDVGASVPRGSDESAAAMELTSTYFDTSAHDLYAAGVTLRRRHGASDQGWQRVSC